MDHKMGGHTVVSSNGTLHFKHYTSTTSLKRLLKIAVQETVLGHIWLPSLQVSALSTAIKAILDILSSGMLHASQPIS